MYRLRQGQGNIGLMMVVVFLRDLSLDGAAAAFRAEYPDGPLFGVAPCPTTIFTLGLFLMAGRLRKAVWAVPLWWSFQGSFAALQTSFDDKDEPILVGVRPTGEQVTVEGMSQGTCDQLFLALRLATLERYLAQHEPLPFVVDDILIHFDDQRALATLKVLAALSRKTQILFFTHHQRLIELAESSIDLEALRMHRMSEAEPHDMHGA